MKSAFSRQFGLTAGMLLLSFILLGTSFTSLLYNHLVREQKTSLSTNATAVRSYISAQGSIDEVTSWDNMLSISYGASVSDTDVLITDETGNVLVCSCNEFLCDHMDAQVPASMLETAMRQDYVYATGVLEGVYEDDRYLYGVPVWDSGEENLVGFVLVSSEAKDMSDMMGTMIYLFLMTAVVVLLVTTVATIIITRRQTKTVRALAKAARQFAHGDFSARIDYEGADAEVADLAVAFNNMATFLQKAELQRQEFISNVSHELKTPMTSIAGFMDGMLDGTIPKERHAHYMKAVSDEVKRLSRMVRSMLEISRMSSTGEEIQKTKFDVTEALGVTLLSFEQKIEQKNLDVQVHMPDRAVNVMANKDSITQVIYNLIDNGVKFATPGTPFVLTVAISGSKALISVANTGNTIPPDELPLLFDRFHKSDKSRSEDTSGVGLGLYIVKTILGSHGEDITVTSRDGVTTFTFGLTLAK